MTYLGVSQLAGTRELVALNGVTHHFDIRRPSDIFTWTLTFLDAELRGNPVSKSELLQATHVAGGGDDFVVIPYNGSAVGGAAQLQRLVVGGTCRIGSGLGTQYLARRRRDRRDVVDLRCEWQAVVARDGGDERRLATPIRAPSMKHAGLDSTRRSIRRR
jgi:hypothetical protein